MAIVNGYTAEHMEQIKNNVIVDGSVIGNNLVLVKQSGATVDAGNVRGTPGTNGVNGTNGSPGVKGDKGDPGTSGVWYSAASPAAISPVDSTYKTLASINIPAVSYSRQVCFWGQVSFLGLTTTVAIYRAAIRLGTGSSASHLPWYCSVDGLSGAIALSTGPLAIGVGVSPTYNFVVRRDTGSGGQTDGDPAQTKFYGLVTTV
jgi:hypothetical protein